MAVDGDDDYQRAKILLDADDAAGLALLRRTAEAGHPGACFRLGLAFAQGLHGVAIDHDAALRWCRRAAEGGLGKAQFNLGLLHAVGAAADARTAARWLRLAALNGVAEADGCLEILYHDASDDRPRTWDEAETRASVALVRTDPDAPKSLRFAEYYVDPCLDLLQRQLRLQRTEVEDIVQQFFLELEEPLERGANRGRRWKEVLRDGYRPTARFRPFLGRALINFARDWLRRRSARPAARPDAAAGPDEEIAQQEHRWGPLLRRFAAETAPRRPDAARAVAVLQGILVEDLDQTALAARLGVTDRTVRSSLRLAAELLRDWLERLIPAAGTDADPVAEGLRRGLDEVPAWLHGISIGKRRRLLLYLALFALHTERRANLP